MAPDTADSIREALAGLANLQNMFTKDLNAIVPQGAVKYQQWQQENPENKAEFSEWLIRVALAELGEKVGAAAGKIVEAAPAKRRKTAAGANAPLA